MVEGQRWVTVMMSTELVEQLREWSAPVQVKVINHERLGLTDRYELLAIHWHPSWRWFRDRALCQLLGRHNASCRGRLDHPPITLDPRLDADGQEQR